MTPPTDGYAEYASFYDAALGDRAWRIARVQGIISRYAPECTSVLELACGTGSILAGLDARYRLAGLDASPAMLKIARAKVHHAQFFHGDMANFHLPQQFDAIFCTFNSTDHLPSFAAWQSMFACAAEHLARGGLFFFDANTPRRLQQLAEHHQWTKQLADGGQLRTTVTALPGDVFAWRMEYTPVAHAGKPPGPRRVQTVHNRPFSPERVVTALSVHFSIVDVVPSQGDPMLHEDAGRLYYICRKR